MNCVAWSDFHYDAGELAVVGPYLNERTCVSGKTCRVEALLGLGLSDNDQLVVLDTCGVDSSVRLRSAQHFLTDLRRPQW